MATSRHRLLALQEERLARYARTSLRTFVEFFWPVLEPATPFVGNWHIDYLCEWLEAITAGECQRLVINMPPRYGKSILVSVLWPTWEWTTRPSGRWLCVSHSETLAEKLSLDRRRVLLSDRYGRCYPHVRLTADQASKMAFHNTQRGVMLAASMGASLTGKGGDRLIIDDPLTPEQAASPVLLPQAADRYTHSLQTRLDDKRHGATVLLMQRLDERDLTAVCLERGFDAVVLPAVAEQRTVCVFPRSGRVVERAADEALWPAREDRAQLAQTEREMGSTGWASQYQQRPVPQRGAIFKKDAWAYYDEAPIGGQWIQSWDLSFKDSDGCDFVAGLLAKRDGELIYLMALFLGRAAFTASCEVMRSWQARFPQTAVVLVEEAANGAAVVDALKRDVPGITAVPPMGSKRARALAAQPRVEAQQVLLPQPVVEGVTRADRAWVEAFIDHCAAFPRGEHDDDVDAFTQLIAYANAHPHVAPVSAWSPPDPPQGGWIQRAMRGEATPRVECARDRVLREIYRKRGWRVDDDGGA